MNTQNGLIALLLAAVVVLGGFAYWTTVQTPFAENTSVVATTTSDTVTTTSTTIKIALLDTTGKGTGKSRGCDNVAMVSRTVPATSAPLTAAMQALFAEKEGAQPSAAYNFIARTKSTLTFDHATVANGTANIYLTGKLSGLAGVCDDPRAAIQIEETALQFATVTKVQIYLNGSSTPLTPSEKGK